MIKRKFKTFVVPTIYLLAIFVFGISLYLIEGLVNNKKLKSDDNIEYVDKEIFEDNYYIPVVSTSESINKPYLNEEIKINKSFYNKDSEQKNQENSIIYYENTYLQNSGIDYQYEETFDVVSILSGTVIEVSDNKLLGKTIKIKHTDNLISVYQSVSEVNISENDTVSQGQIIAKSGTSSVYNEKNNLHFELIYNGECVNPEEYYNKDINEFA